MDFKEWIELTEAEDVMDGFKGWYNFNRGNWSEVEAAAQKSPNVRMILNRMKANFNGSNTKGEFAMYGDQIEKAVEAVFPQHSKVKQRQQWEKERFQGGRPAAAPVGPTRTARPGATGGDNGFQLGSPKPQAQAGDSDLSQVVSDHERRLRNLETFLKGNHNKQPHEVGAMDATASYHR